MSLVARRSIGALAAATFVVGLALPTAPAAAISDSIIINEVYARGGSANQPFINKYVELYNPTDAPVELAELSLQYRSAGGDDVANAAAELSGTVEAGGYFVIAMNSNGDTGAPLPATDLSTTLTPSGTNGTLFVATGTAPVNPDELTAVVDKVGYGTSNSPEGTAASYDGSNSTPGSIGRTTFADTDDNSVDFTFADEPTPGGPNIGQPGGPTDPVDPVDPVDPIAVPIAGIQGTGAASPLAEQAVSTVGVVTAVYPTGGFDGFYLQTPGSGGAIDATPGASDGIFVFGPTSVAIGECYTVTGTVTEFFGLTELADVTLVATADCAPVTPVELTALPATDAEKEPYEGMLVQPVGNYTITNNYQLNQYGQLGLAYGDEPLYTPTEVVPPGPEAQAVAASNTAKYITLDDGSSWNYLENSTAQNSPLPYLSQATPMRTGSQVTFSSPVILDYRFQWNFQPVGQIVGADDADIPVLSENDRPVSAPDVGGDIQLGVFNVLNYFTDLGQAEEDCDFYPDKDGNPVAADFCEVRGAWSDQAFADQQAKIVSAINEMDAEIVALMEIQNSAAISYRPGQDRDKALAALVAALNAAGGSWAYVPSPPINAPGEDVIRTAFIYNPAAVTPVGASQILLDGSFANARYPLAQSFEVTGSETSFVAIANHFKSKGSGEDDGTGQGNSNPSREAQAAALAQWANTNFAGEPIFLVGDFNAYTQETPVQIIEQNGYTNVEKLFDNSTTYQFQGRLGSLDHVFANEAAMELVSSAAVWNINADEAVAMQYSRRNYNVVDFHEPTPYASSDHDPSIVGIIAAPVDPADPTDPVDPGSPSDPVDPTDPVDPSNPGAPGQPGNPAGTPGGVPHAGDGSLARTGVEAVNLGMLALALVGTGAALTAGARRRR